MRIKLFTGVLVLYAIAVFALPAVSLAAPTDASVFFTKTLRLGSKNEEVKRLQALLKQYPDIYPIGKVTGYYGLATRNAVGRLQKQYGLKINGAADTKTRDTLNRLAARTTSAGDALKIV
jgi:peptidoglycan hydrolase-like protein with peptidoglycan-binding domain